MYLEKCLLSLIAFDEGGRLLVVYGHEVVTVLYAILFHGLDAILDRPGTFCLDLMCSVFLIRAGIYFVTLVHK